MSLATVHFACARSNCLSSDIRTLFIIFSGTAAQRGLWLPRHTRFIDHTQRRTTVGRTSQDEWLQSKNM
jgi:hypothetical protein